MRKTISSDSYSTEEYEIVDDDSFLAEKETESPEQNLQLQIKVRLSDLKGLKILLKDHTNQLKELKTLKALLKLKSDDCKNEKDEKASSKIGVEVSRLNEDITEKEKNIAKLNQGLNTEIKDLMGERSKELLTNIFKKFACSKLEDL